MSKLHIMILRFHLWGILFLLGCVANSSANVKLPGIFGNHMVLQQNRPVTIWGWAKAGEKITIEFAGQIAHSKADLNGRWKIILKESKGGPYTMTIKGENTIQLQDVLMGDVWLCSGQSNMEWPLSFSENGNEEIEVADFPEIRFFMVPKNVQFKPSEDIDTGGSWKKVSPQTIGEFSALAYYFGKNLYQKYRFPVGLIGSYWGGTDIETWMSKESLTSSGKCTKELNQLNTFDEEKYRKELDARRLQTHRYATSTTDGLINGKAVWAEDTFQDDKWEEMTLPGLWETSLLPDLDGVVWFRKKIILTKEQASGAATLIAGQIDDSDQSWINGKLVGQTSQQYNALRKYKIPSGVLKEGTNIITIRVEDTGGGGGVWGDPENVRLEVANQKLPLSGKWKFQVSPGFTIAASRLNPNQFPTLLYNGMIYPIQNLALQGVIWYQGENNVSRAKDYSQLFPLMIQDWRSKFNDQNIEFLYVQLASFMARTVQPEESEWADLREAQDAALKLPRVGNAVAIDVGDANDIHPRNKKDLGYRLSLSARKFAYNDSVEYSGPVIKSATTIQDKIKISFSHTGKGLMCTSKYGYVMGFQVAGPDKKFYWAKAWLEGNDVVVQSNEVKTPSYVRYAWANNPDEANLYNKEGLPAGPFQYELKQ